MMRFVPLVLGVLAVAGSAIDSGRVTRRWEKTDNMASVAARVKTVPTEIGDWKSEERELDAHQVEVARIEGYISRVYINRRTGEHLHVMLICGRPGPIAVHEPRDCYANAGFTPSRTLDKVTVAGDEFKAGNFTKGPPHPENLRILWGWTTDGRWLAPEIPRGAFGREIKPLFKLYVIRQVPPDEAATTKDPAVSFLDVLLPELKRCLAPAA